VTVGLSTPSTVRAGKLPRSRCGNADHVVAEVRARRLAEVRKRQYATQVEVAAAMGVSQARVSRIEKGQLEKSEVETLAAYVKALGGKLKIVADFGDESYVLG
jgi:DNA-binding XRE family transcriptional regulator